MSRRGGTPLRGTPSLEAANQHQIEDLVQRNRTLEHTNKKLSEQLVLELSRGKDTVSEIQEQFKLNEHQWRDGCDELLSCYRLVQQQTVVELQRERTNVLKEQELLRKEKLQRLQRDYRILKFQAREAELEDKIVVLEEEKDLVVADYETVVNRLKEKCVDYAAYAKIKEKEVILGQRQYDQLEGKLNKQLEENANLQASAEAKASKLERVTLQYDGAQTKCAELERSNDELKRTSGELTRQLDKWQSLETKGGDEIDLQRRKRIEAELEVKTLKDQLVKMEEKVEKMEEKEAQELAREKRRVDKMKNTVQEWQEEAEKQQNTADEATKQLTKAKKQLEKLKSELEVERARVRPLSSSKRRSPSPIATEDEEEEVANEIELMEPPTPRRETKPQSRTSGKPASRQPPRSRQATAVPESENEAGPSRKTKSKDKETGGKRKSKKKDAESSEVEEVVVEEPPPKPRPKPRSKAVPTPAPDSEVEEVEVPKKGKGKAKAVAEEIQEPPPTINKGKRKARDDDNDSEIEIVGSRTAAAKGAGREGSEAKKPAAKPRRGTARAGSRAASVQPAAATSVDVDAEEEDVAPKKKKRKINIFPANTGPTDFNFMGGVGGGSGLDIPTMLSPVKETENVPTRSTTGSIAGSLGSMGNMLKSRLTGRR